MLEELKYCYILICCIMTTQWLRRRDKDRHWETFSICTAQAGTRHRKTSKKNIYLSLYCKVRKGCSRFACERVLETEQKLQYFDPTVMTVTLCLSCSLGLFNRRPRAHSAGCWLSLLHLISIFSGPESPSEFPSAPSVGCGFPYHISSPTVWNSTGNSTGSSNSTELYNRSTPTRSLKSNV